MNLKAELQKYGISSGSIQTFGTTPIPEMLDYLDLIEPRKQEALLPDGVAESQGQPLLFFVDESHLAVTATEQETNLKKLRRTIACRGERAYLARILPGEIKVVPVRLDERTPNWQTYHEGTAEAETFFSRLALGQYDGLGEPASPDQVFKTIFELLKQGADRLAGRIGRSDVLSLVGRALFFRFLQDRQVIKEQHLNVIAPRASSLTACFDTPEDAAATCAWLDRTFNGHFLHLSSGGGTSFFEEIATKTQGEVFQVLTAILCADQPTGSEHYQGRFNWGDFEFAHIPVGLLSQVYEKFIWKWAGREAKETSVYYTPRNIAAMLVNEAFDQLPDAYQACVLDPACGAGVFLVLAFRRLYRERWKATGHRPDTKAIRAILEKQLRGFDISESALKLSALSLYLTAIELDPEPVPPEKLIFRDLQNEVLFNCRPANSPEEGISIGSLGPHLSSRFHGKFDLILSNPPWTSLARKPDGEDEKQDEEDEKKRKQLAEEFTNVSRDVIRTRGGDAWADAYQNPDSAPDLPFVWKSAQWCKPGGRIAMALPGRILFKQEAVPAKARDTLFQLLEVTGIINGSNLSDTKVWPDMQQPFMLMFARNRRPRADHVIRFITPHYDAALNRRGQLRIDSKSAEPLELAATTEVPWIWKALAIGTALDFDVVRKLSTAGGRPLKAYWEDLKLKSGTGYQIKPNQNRPRTLTRKADQEDASDLHGLPDLASTELFDFVVNPNLLQEFLHPTAFRPRERDLYRRPLVLVKESPGTERETGRALLSHVDVAFNESFHGYSGWSHPEGETLVRYVHLLVHSNLWMHYALLTSPKLGAERRRFYKSDLDDFPIVPLEKVSEHQKRDISSLSKRLESADKTVFPEIDAFFGSLYGLNTVDIEVIEDTLRVCLPYKKSRDRACERPGNPDRQAFCQKLESLLFPFFKVIGKRPEVMLAKLNEDLDSQAPFSVLTISVRGQQGLTPSDSVTKRVFQLASKTGATRIIQEQERALVIGILNQYRYWTLSRARLLAAEILRRHTAVFEEE
jgi:SAM-dependent methyltransferase